MYNSFKNLGGASKGIYGGWSWLTASSYSVHGLQESHLGYGATQLESFYAGSSSKLPVKPK